ncbi:helix-turn-helix transcriptional regulator [Aminobacter anthyllidis]|uniref:Helix-turn-helix transcriptional regulator n=1 Tax=Aminobacter anthyllidis TaxID=1035067 RepID=A0A9X1A7K3_9HYPH|nr:helix-turn-helix transcriptional regulator [Aminobacter anthyllidis]MBT1154709.1 helix-turn-helix transcriptional regulator [Aminobacter anthyllidis]
MADRAEAQGAVPDHDQLVVLLYAGISEASPFDGFLKALRAAVDAESSTLIIERQRRDRPGAIYSGAASEERIARYNALYKQDPFIDLPLGKVTTLAELVGEEGFSHSEFMTNFMTGSGWMHVVGADIVEASGARVRMRATRVLGRDNFGTSERETFQRLLPHLTQAMSLFLRLNGLESERELFAGALGRLAVGAIIVDKECRILQATPQAEAILAEKDVLKNDRGRLRLLDDAGPSGAFTAAVAEIAEADPASFAGSRAFSIHRSSGEALGLVVRPAPHSAKLHAPLRGAALVIIADAGSTVAPQPAILVRLFGLTPAEAELAALMGQGLDLDDASAALGVTKNTAKAHLRMVFSKTGVSRQSELVRLLLRSVDELS